MKRSPSATKMMKLGNKINQSMLKVSSTLQPTLNDQNLTLAG